MGNQKIRESLITGIIIVTPLLATLFILKVLFGWTRIVTDPVVKGTRLTQYTANIDLVAQIVALGIVLTGLTLLGLISRNRYGSKIIGRFGKFAHIIPVFRTLYFNIKQVTNAVTGREHQFQKTVMIEYPKEGSYKLGFVTSSSPREIQEKKDQEMMNVFLPQSPNPTAGELIITPKERIKEVDISVKKALKLLMTSGMSTEKEEIPTHLITEE